jgi:large subunit ribosomal protein L21
MDGGIAMYAVIRAGGKQYRVAPGDVVKIEKAAHDGGQIEFEVLAVSSADGKLGKVEDAKVVGQVLGDGRADKILVFHFKRKKQYKKLNGHRQPFTQVRISEISAGGKTEKAPERRNPKLLRRLPRKRRLRPRRLRRKRLRRKSPRRSSFDF